MTPQENQGNLNLEHPDVPSMTHAVLIIMVGIGVLFFSARFLGRLGTFLMERFVMIAVPIWACYMFRFNPKRTFFLRFPGIRSSAGLLIGFVGIMILLLVLRSQLIKVDGIRPTTEQLEQFRKQMEPILALHPAWLFLIIAVLTPVAEEILFRGFLFRAGSESTGFIGGAIITTTLFAVLHGVLLRQILMTVLGFYLVAAVWESRSLLPSLFIHITYNTSVLLLESSQKKTGGQVTTLDGITSLQKAGIMVFCLILIVSSLYLFRLDRQQNNDRDKSEPLKDGELYDPIFGP